MSYSTLTSLPPEVLLEIAACLTHLTRNTDLANLSLVSQRLRPIAQEWLLKAPRFSLKYIDRYMYELAQQPKLWAQVYKLEIWSKNEGRVKYDERGLSIKEYISTKAATGIPSGSLETVCKVVMERYVCSEAMEAEWRAALQDDVVPALFTVLLCMLSKLKELTLGNAWSMDFPIFAHLLSPNTRALPYIPTAWSSSYSAPAVITRIWQLKVLELPADMTAMYFLPSVSALIDTREVKQLRELRMTWKASSGLGRTRGSVDPRTVLPKSLEVLRISEATQTTTNLFNFVCLAKKKGHFPVLRRVEVYYGSCLMLTELLAAKERCPHPVEDIRKMSEDALVTVYLYFPPWGFRTWDAGGTPWGLGSEKRALERGEIRTCRKDIGMFGVEDVF